MSIKSHYPFPTYRYMHELILRVYRYESRTGVDRYVVARVMQADAVATELPYIPANSHNRFVKIPLSKMERLLTFRNRHPTTARLYKNLHNVQNYKPTIKNVLLPVLLSRYTYVYSKCDLSQWIGGTVSKSEQIRTQKLFHNSQEWKKTYSTINQEVFH